jgi:ceramide glucosyltransferase
MIYVFCAFAVLLVWLSFRSFLNGIEYLKYFKQRLAERPSSYTPYATVFVPCRGIDQELAENLHPLTEQDYPGYELIFVVDDGADECMPLIEELMRKTEKQTKLVIAGKATDTGQKVENLRQAVLHVAEESRVFVFTDSDVRTSKNWLQALVAPLEDESIGATTGYRWFIAQRRTFGSEMRSVWNASIAAAMGPNEKTNFCWGGSTAIRRDVFDRVDMRRQWRGTVSDDFALTSAVKAENLRVVFVPQALTPSIGDCRVRDLLEFTTRQLKITRVYAPHLWLTSFFGSGLFLAIMITAFLTVVFSRSNSAAVWVSLITMLLVAISTIGKAWTRLTAARLVLTGYDAELRPQYLPHIALWPLAAGLFFYNSLAALLSRRLTWRGISYELKSPGETVIITD